jgi:hypothetical protein
VGPERKTGSPFFIPLWSMSLKKLLGLFEKDMFQLIEFELFFFDHAILRGGQALYSIFKRSGLRFA